MGVPPRLNPAQRKEAAALYAGERSLRQIADHFDCSVNAVRNALKAENVTLREKFAAGKLRLKFPHNRHPVGGPSNKPTFKPLNLPRCSFVFDLALPSLPI
jgi:hypothetical protein